ncbi:MAG: hypothetical protein ACR2N7_11205 [Acidimicrobiia bacterium]
MSLFDFELSEPLIDLSLRPDLLPISIGLRTLNTLYDSQVALIQAGAMLALSSLLS